MKYSGCFIIPEAYANVFAVLSLWCALYQHLWTKGASSSTSERVTWYRRYPGLCWQRFARHAARGRSTVRAWSHHLAYYRADRHCFLRSNWSLPRVHHRIDISKNDFSLIVRLIVYLCHTIKVPGSWSVVSCDSGVGCYLERYVKRALNKTVRMKPSYRCFLIKNIH